MAEKAATWERHVYAHCIAISLLPIRGHVRAPHPVFRHAWYIVSRAHSWRAASWDKGSRLARSQRTSLEPAWLDAKCLAGVLGMGSMAERLPASRVCTGWPIAANQAFCTNVLTLATGISTLRCLTSSSLRQENGRLAREPSRCELHFFFRGHLAKENGNATQFNMYAGSPLTT